MQRITYFERQIIESGIRCNKSVRAIARSLNRDHRVLQREVNRNSGDILLYTAVSAQRIHESRQKKKNKKKLERLENKDLKKYIIEKIKEDWSPEQIAGVLKEHKPKEVNNKRISHESIYQYIYNGQGKYEYLYPHLRKKKRKRQKRRSRKNREKCLIPDKISIHERPNEINTRSVTGHWESDTLEGKKSVKDAISVQYERKLQLAKLNKIQNMTADETENALRKTIDSVPGYACLSFTLDNGKEGANHAKIRNEYNIDTYHCDPYKSWQKGGVENLNGLIRQYIPKSTDMSVLTDEYVYYVQERLNNRPRKSLNYLTPNQAFAQFTGQSGAIKP